MMLSCYIYFMLITAFALYGAAEEQLTLADCFRSKTVIEVKVKRHYATIVTQVRILGAKTFAGVACIVEGCYAEFVQKVAGVYKTSLARNAVSITDDLSFFNECIFEDACVHVLSGYKESCRVKLKKTMRVQAVWFAEFKQKGVVHEFGDPTIKPVDAVPMRKLIWPIAVEKQLNYGPLQEGKHTAPMLRFDADLMARLLTTSGIK